jgi:hypothetical protein
MVSEEDSAPLQDPPQQPTGGGVQWRDREAMLPSVLTDSSYTFDSFLAACPESHGARYLVDSLKPAALPVVFAHPAASFDVKQAILEHISSIGYPGCEEEVRHTGLLSA